MKFQNDMKLRRRNQKNVHRHCEEMLRNAERKAERESIALIEAYKKHEKHVYRRIEKQREADPEHQEDYSHH